jgi:hypothetical protein
LHGRRLTVAAGIALLFAYPFAPRPVAADGPPPAQQPAPATEQELVERFAPVYYLREQSRACDSNGEPFAPADVEMLFGDETIRLRGLAGGDIAGPSAADLAGAGADAFLDFPGDPRRPGCRYEKDFARLAEGRTPAVYARIAREEGREGLAVQYWAYYYFNDWNNTHESDWEMVSLVFDAETAAEALQEGPVLAAYADHGSGERRDWDSDRVEKEGGRPAVYVSAGSHASYFQPDTYLGLGEQGSGFGCDVASGPHRRLEPRIVLLDDAGDREPATPWLLFEGRWGERLPGEFNGPTGPQTKRAWREPISWADDVRTGTISLPGDDLLGTNNVRTFCGLVADASRLLRAFFQFPVLVGGSLILAVGMMGGAALVVAKDAVRDPLVGSGPGFLRRKRTIGQLVRAAAVVYWRHRQLFLGFSLLFIPIEALFSLVHPWLVSVPPFENVLWLFNANEVSRLAMALVVGGLASAAVYLLVVPTAITAMRRLDAGERVTIGSAYRAAWPSLGHIVGARLRALLIIGLLGFSVVGLPLAAWLALRWFFIEQAVVIDGETFWSAPGASGHAVEGRAWRGAASSLLFGVFGATAGPLLAIALLLGSDLDAALINALSGLFHAAMLPFTAIGLSLAYCDLQIRAAEASPRIRRRRRPHTGIRRVAAAAGGLVRGMIHLWEGRRRR